MNLQANTTNNGERFALVVYDVPDKSGAPRPPSLMHRIGVRINWSCWLVPLANLPRVPVDEWKAAGADVESRHVR